MRLADDLGMQCGGWTVTWQGGHGEVTHGGTTILAAIRQAVSPDTQLSFSPDGSSLGNPDAVIVVMGESPYAETRGDRTNLDLSAEDTALIDRAKKFRRACRDHPPLRPSIDFKFRAG